MTDTPSPEEIAGKLLSWANQPLSNKLGDKPLRDDLEQAAALILSMKAENEKARDYLIRNVLLPYHPQVVALPDLLGVCTQADNIATEIRSSRLLKAETVEVLGPAADAHETMTRLIGLAVITDMPDDATINIPLPRANLRAISSLHAKLTGDPQP